MPEQVTAWKAGDGSLHPTEENAKHRDLQNDMSEWSAFIAELREETRGLMPTVQMLWVTDPEGCKELMRRNREGGA